MRPGKFYNHLTGKIASLSLFLLGLGHSGQAQVVVTPAGNGTGICANRATNGSAPTYTLLDPILIDESATNDFPAVGVYNLTLELPAGWEFDPASSPAAAATSATTDISVTSTTLAGNQVVIALNVATATEMDQLTITGLNVRPSTTTSASGNVFAAVAGTTTDPIVNIVTGAGGTNFGSLSVQNQYSGVTLGNPSVCPGVTTANVDILTPAILPTGDYTITWDATAITDGFVNDGPTAISSASIPVAINTVTAVPGTTYNGNIMFSDGCSELSQPITVTIFATPTVTPTSDLIVCNGATVPDINFTGAASTFNWTAYDMAGTAVDGGTDVIPSFTASNATPNPDSFYVVVTPVDNGCNGPADTFWAVINPTPHLVSTTTTACEGQSFTFVNASLTAGTTYKWERPADAYNTTPASGTGDITETLNNGTLVGFHVFYTDTLDANGCRNVELVDVTVNPQPVVTVSPTPGTICSGDMVNYTLSADVIGTTFSWFRAADADNATNAGTTALISENLLNTTLSSLTVTYVDTISANGCVYIESFGTTVNPIPAITSATSASVCDSAEFHYVPTSTLTGTTYTWDRAVVAGIANPAGSGADSITEYLDNTTASPVVVTYVITMTSNSCSDTAHLHVTVNPLPTLTSPLTASTCTNAPFNYTATPSLSGTTMTWTRAAVTGITPATNSGTGNISETLVNTTTAPITVKYIYSLTLAGGCPNTDTVTVTVNPLPALTSTHNPTPICDSTLFTYTPMGTTGATFNWYRRYVPGIVSLSVTGTGPISEYLDNSTYVPVQVAYIFTVSVGSCTAIDSIHLTVNPTPVLSTHKNDSACSGIPYLYSPLAGSSLVTFAWSRATVSGISPTTGSGTGNISETLVNSNTTATTVQYTYTMSIAAGTGACTNTQKLNVKVNPFIGAPSITLKSETSLCAGTMFQNFGTSAPQPTGVKYAWSAKNASVYASGSDKQYALVSFPTAGTAVVYINTTSNTTGCIGRDSATVTVAGGSAQNPGVIYTTGQLIALQNDVDSYQWGYDDKNTLKPDSLSGEINQNYFISASDLNSRYYWVKTKKNGCTQKSYYNKPTGVVEINGVAIAMKLFPNPADQYVNVEISTNDYNNMTLEVFNMLGQQITAETVSGSTSQINAAALPAGVYIVDCVQNGVKVASARFIKN